jgi:prephenate dehydrogenase
MKTDFQNITILGGGLLGGSLALALTGLENPPCVRLWVRKSEAVDEARAIGIEKVTLDLAEAIQEVENDVLTVGTEMVCRADFTTKSTVKELAFILSPFCMDRQQSFCIYILFLRRQKYR